MTETLQQLESALSNKERLFAQGIFEGKSQSDAVKEAGYKVNGTFSASATGNRLLKKVKISSYLDALRAESTKQAVWNFTRKRELLYEMGEDEENKPNDRIAAIRTDNEMMGHNKAQKIEGEITLSDVVKALGSSTGLPSEEDD